MISLVRIHWRSELILRPSSALSGVSALFQHEEALNSRQDLHHCVRVASSSAILAARELACRTGSSGKEVSNHA